MGLPPALGYTRRFRTRGVCPAMRTSRRLQGRQLWVGLFFLMLLLMGYSLHQDYGISWDEPQQRLIGEVSERYVLDTLLPFLDWPQRQVPPLHEFRDKDYGVTFELPAVLLERLLGVSDPQAIYFLRHWLTFLVFVAGCYALHRMVTIRTGDWRLGLLAATLLVLSPRFFAEAYYNSKDIVFMAVFAMAMASLMALIARPGWRVLSLHAFLSALAVDTRIMAVLLVAATVLVLMLQALRGEQGWRRTLAGLAVYLLLTYACMVAMFPYLWAAPVDHVVAAFQAMSKFQRWGGDVLYFGEFINGYELPWHYLPVWIGLTTPPLVLGLLAIGVVVIGWALIRSGYRLYRTPGELQDLLALGLLVAPIAAVIVLGSVVYNGWRHVYFVYPALLFVAMRGLTAVAQGLRSSRVRWLLPAVVAAALVWQATWIIRAHPLQNVYFNGLAGEGDLRHRFELDYWGLANRQALETILAMDDSSRIVVIPGSFTPLHYSVMMLDPEQRQRLAVPPHRGPRTADEPHYLIDNYQFWERWYSADRFSEGYEPVHRIRVNGEIVLTIYRSLEDEGQP